MAQTKVALRPSWPKLACPVILPAGSAGMTLVSLRNDAPSEARLRLTGFDHLVDEMLASFGSFSVDRYLVAR
jgi:hypothetical protein